MTQTTRLLLDPENVDGASLTFERVLDFDWRVASTSGESAEIGVTVSRAQLKTVGLNGPDVTFDTDSPEKGEGYAATLEPLLRAMCGVELTGRVAADGEVSGLEVPTALGEEFEAAPGAELFDGFSPSAGLENLLRVGWLATKKQRLPTGQGGSFLIETKHTPGEAEGALQRIVTEGRVVLLPQAEESQQELALGSSNLQGEVLFDAEAGVVRSSERKLTVELSVTQQGVTRVLGVEQDVRFETVGLEE